MAQSSSNPSDSPPSVYSTRSPTENQFSSSSSTSSSSPSPSPPLFLAAIIPLPTFRGLPNECPVAHLTLFHRLFLPSSSSSSSALLLSRNFPFTLLDDAALWHELSVQPHPSMPWDQTQSAFLRAFRPPDSPNLARAEIVSLRQRRRETVNSYHLRMHWILKRWPEHGLPDSLLKGLFVDGLREELRDWVMVGKPETLEEAVRIAVDWEGVGKGRRDLLRKKKNGGEVKEDERFQRGVSIGSVGRRLMCQCSKHGCSNKYEKSRSVEAAVAPPEDADPACAAD